jgi:hypothetical protein
MNGEVILSLIRCEFVARSAGLICFDSRVAIEIQRRRNHPNLRRLRRPRSLHSPCMTLLEACRAGTGARRTSGKPPRVRHRDHGFTVRFRRSR